jgi:N-acetylated-alpha-linked acidic dipeptidase
VKGKIVIVRYGQNFRGIKVELAQQRGAVGVIIYSDPINDGYVKGDMYPRGAWRPASAVQRGSVQFLSIYPGDPQTPGVASTPDLPDSARMTDGSKMNQPSIPANPLSYEDAEPILRTLDGPATPRDWQGGLPFTYHVGGTGAVKAHMNLVQDYKLRTIWDVIGTIPGEDTASWVVAGNHRDAWVYGAVDPNSGTAAMLETVHGLGELLKQGWKPKRTIVIGSWDAEEEGLIGSTEWVEMHGKELAHAVAYFNMDVGVAGPDFTASALPSLMAFVQQATEMVPSPKGGNVLEQWRKQHDEEARKQMASGHPEPELIGTLGSGSDFTPFLQHAGVPSTDIGSEGPYGVYHSVYDNYNWYIKNADPTFVYLQQQARVFGVEILHMADADILPYDYQLYGHAIQSYVNAAAKRAQEKGLKLNFEKASLAAARMAFMGERLYVVQTRGGIHIPLAEFNEHLRKAEATLLSDAGLPNRPWYKHMIYAPGEYTGYAAVTIPGISEGMDAGDLVRTQAQIDALTLALLRAGDLLNTAVYPLAAPEAPAK